MKTTTTTTTTTGTTTGTTTATTSGTRPTSRPTTAPLGALKTNEREEKTLTFPMSTAALLASERAVWQHWAIFKVLGDKISKKVAQIIGNFLDKFKKLHSYVKSFAFNSYCLFLVCLICFNPFNHSLFYFWWKKFITQDMSNWKFSFKHCLRMVTISARYGAI